MKKKVLVGMSGGVDSAVTALKLKRAGFDVTGAIIEIWDPEEQTECGSSTEKARPWSERGCCHVPMVRYLCEEVLSIPFVMVDR
ncbi:tRNA methyl transferase-like domain protein, partial [mine drainage metagenome]